MFGLNNRVDKVIWPTKRDLSAAGASSVTPSSETSALESLYGDQITL